MKGTFLFVAALFAVVSACRWAQADPPVRAKAPRLKLDFEHRGDKILLVCRHPEIGVVFKFWCYETGPFRKGSGEHRDDGSIVLKHKSGDMTSTTTFTALDAERIAMDVVVEGPVRKLRKIPYMGPCMQYQQSPAFRRRGDLSKFASRCFIYTMRGPLWMLETHRGKMRGFKDDARENNPPWTQWYVPIHRPHWGNVWAFGAAGDRPVHDIVGVRSRDGKWIAAVGCKYNMNLGQGWHDCIHHSANMQKYLDAKNSRIVHKSMIYVMRNDRRKLLETFRKDFPLSPEERTFELKSGADAALELRPDTGAPKIELTIDVLASIEGQAKDLPWKEAWWGTFARGGKSWRMWAHRTGDVVNVVVSFAPQKWKAVDARATVTLAGKGWKRTDGPRGVPATVLCSGDGKWTVAFFWERSEADAPEKGIPVKGLSLALRGKLCLFRGKPDELRKRWAQSSYNWRNAVPFLMPLR